MQLFHAKIENQKAILSPEEARHASKVLRKRPGDKIDVIDGSGHLFHCKIIDVQRNKVEVEVLQIEENFGAIPYELHIAIAPTKNNDRFEWFLEKATEMGVSSIYPVIGQHSERAVIKPERLEKVLLSAAKQSLKGLIPKLHPLQKFSQFVQAPFKGDKFIAHCATGEKVSLFDEINPKKPTLICIGPEGDFSADEVTLATQKGFAPVALGASRLRTETAGIAAVAAMYLKT